MKSPERGGSVEEMVARLGELRPGVYGHLDPKSLGSMLRAAGVPVSTVWDSSKPRDKGRTE